MMEGEDARLKSLHQPILDEASTGMVPGQAYLSGYAEIMHGNSARGRNSVEPGHEIYSPSGRPFHCLNYSWLVGHFPEISMPAP